MSITMRPDMYTNPAAKQLPFDVGTLFSFDGRIDRRTYWLTMLADYLVSLTLLLSIGLLAGEMLGSLFLLVAILILIPATIISLATHVKRLHDRGRSGWFYLITFVPYIGSMILLIECGLRRGSKGRNAYGDPNSGSPFQS